MSESGGFIQILTYNNFRQTNSNKPNNLVVFFYNCTQETKTKKTYNRAPTTIICVVGGKLRY